MNGSGNDKQFLIVSFEALIGVLTVEKAVGVFAVNQQDRAFQFIQIGQQRRVDKGQRIGNRGSAVGVQAPLVIAAFLILIPV